MAQEISQTIAESVDRSLNDFVAAARSAFGDDLRAAILYGSAAEGRMRATSDVNLLLVLARFDKDKADQLREPLRIAQAAIRLKCMLLMEAELAAATEAFAVKFADIKRRHRVLTGSDPFTSITPSRPAQINRLKQTLLNLTLRLREAYVVRGLREEQLAAVIADAAGPIRACAAALLELEGSPAASPKEALERVAGTLPDGQVRTELLGVVSRAREEQRLPAGVAGPALLSLIDLTAAIRQRVEALT